MLLIFEALLILAALRQDRRTAVEDSISLDKAKNSVDDQYYGCRKNMTHLVETKYLKEEFENSPNFRDAWIAEAIHILKKKQNRCFDTFRGSNGDYNGHVFKDIRFGSFTSSSLNRARAKIFGTKTCFVIHTCEGAIVTKYSMYPVEEEVLIPPYEKFNVTEVKTRTDQPDLWCETVFVLNSTGIRSDLNCALFNEPTKTKMINISGVHLREDLEK